MKIKQIALSLFLIIFAPFVHAEQMRGLEHIYQPNEMRIESYDLNTERKHAAVFCAIKSSNQNHSDIEIIEQGEGNLKTHKQVQWYTVSNNVLQNGIMQIQNSVTDIKDSQGKSIASYRKLFDYQNNEVVYEKTNASDDVTESQKFVLKKPICDNTNLVHFIRGIYASGNLEEFESFYFVTNEPKLYKVNTSFIRDEVLTLPYGEINAVKLQLKADLGPLTEIAAKVVSPTYIWLEKEYPHRWLQYEGRESGRFSPQVRTYLLEHGGGEI